MKNIIKIIGKMKLLLLKIIYRRKIRISKNVSIRRGFIANINGGYLSIGKGVFFNNYCSINSQGKIEIGDNTLFGENVKIYDHNHNFDDKFTPISQQGMKIGQVKIGENCWIGSNVTILMNVSIGNNVIIGANCLIYKSIPDNKIVKNSNELKIIER